MLPLISEHVMQATVIRCSVCELNYTLPVAMERQRRLDGKTFYCPRGHDQCFPPVPQLLPAYVQAHYPVPTQLQGLEMQSTHVNELRARLDKARTCYRHLHEEYRKSRRQVGGIASDRNAFKKQASGAMDEIGHLRAEVVALTSELEGLRGQLSTDEGDILAKCAAAGAATRKKLMIQVLDDLHDRIVKAKALKGISRVRLGEYLRSLYPKIYGPKKK